MPGVLLDADRAPTLQAFARACANQHIDSVTVLHLKDLVQGFWQNTVLSQGTPERPFPGRGARAARQAAHLRFCTFDDPAQ
jgi:hypothetical protein